MGPAVPWLTGSHQPLSAEARPRGICGEEKGTGMWRQLITGTMSAQCLLEREEVYTGCPGRNVPDFRRVFLMLKYTDTTQNTYVQS